MCFHAVSMKINYLKTMVQPTLSLLFDSLSSANVSSGNMFHQRMAV